MAAFNILVVDDAAFIRDLVKKAVRETYPGSNLQEAIDGRRAISLLGTHEIHLVLCDWEMPEVSGIEVLQWMRADERYKSTPFMMITSRGDRDHVVKAVQEGVSEYIGKPFTRENFVAKLSKLVWKHLKIRPQVGDAPENPRAANIKGGLGGASVLMAAAAESTPSKTGVRAKGIADVRFASGGQAKLVIKDINLQELIGVFRREGALPQLLEQAVLDIVDKESGAVARINGYVRMLQAQEPSPDAQTIQMTLRYVDDDPEKLETLSLYIAKVR